MVAGLVALSLRLHWLFTFVIAWSGLSLLVMVGFYLGAALGADPGPTLRGLRHVWLQPLLLPFRAVSLGLHVLSRAVGHTEPVSEVSAGVFVGPRPLGQELPGLRARGVSSVIDLAAELPVQGVFLKEPYALYELPLLDRTAPCDEAFDRAIAWGLGELARGRGVLVHCSFGRGRSGLVACALSMASSGRRESVDEVITRVRGRRPGVNIKSDQRAALERFSERFREGIGLWSSRAME